MNIIGQTPNKFNIDFADGDFESVNQDSSDGTFANKYDIDDLDVILANIRFIKEVMAHVDRMEYFITNHSEAIMNILKKY